MVHSRFKLSYDISGHEINALLCNFLFGTSICMSRTVGFIILLWSFVNSTSKQGTRWQRKSIFVKSMDVTNIIGHPNKKGLLFYTWLHEINAQLAKTLSCLLWKMPYRSIHSKSLPGLSPFARKFHCTYDKYFYFYFIPTWRVMLTMIAVFLFTRQFRRYAILRVKPTAYGNPFFCTSSWWLHVVGQVVVCGCVLLR